MFVDKEPGGPVFLPDAGVADRRINGSAILQFHRQMHWHRGPRDNAVARHPEILAAVSETDSVLSRKFFFPPASYSFQPE